MRAPNNLAFGEIPALAKESHQWTPLAKHKSFLLAVVVLLWVITGLFGRDPWKPQETEFVILIAQINGLLPDLSTASSLSPSLYLDLLAASARLFSPWLPLHEGARVVNIVLLLAAFAMIAAAVGGSVRRRWVAVFFALGMVGLLVRAHLLNVATPEFLGGAMMVWGMAKVRRHALIGGIIISAASLLLANTSLLPLLFLLAAIALSLFHASWQSASVAAGLVTAGFLFASLFLLLPFIPDITMTPIFPSGWVGVIDLLRISAWALFPALPLAAFVIWRQPRIALSEPLLLFCLLVAAAGAAHFILFGGKEEDLFWMMPALSVFAALAIEKLSNEHAIILDWFALWVVGVCFVGGMWVLWLAWHWGVTEWMGGWRAKLPLLQMPGQFNIKILLAAAVTVLWAILAANYGRSIERALINWSCGVTAVWCVFSWLWIPVVDSGKSYRHMAVAIKEHSGDECVDSSPSASAVAAQLYYFGVSFGGQNCQYYLQQRGESTLATGALVWTGGRYDYQNYLLYRRF